jgi:predicted short-subunit dehydrogenase-like oxidoreductase (DUF2520 family)
VRIAVVGAGRAGTAVAVRWRAAGHDIVAASGGSATADRAALHLPGVPVLPPREAATAAELTVLGVPDDRIAEVAGSLAGAIGARAWISHLSGAARLDVLDAAGGRRLALHPLQTLPDVERAVARLEGCAVAIGADDEDGFALGEGLARDLGGVPFRLTDDARPLYHAAAVLGSNDVVALSALALTALARAGVPDPRAALAPIQLATVENVATVGPGAALTGPAVRGDAGTIEANLRALADEVPEAVPTYVAVARAALDLAVAAGRLTPERRAPVEEVLARWT